MKSTKFYVQFYLNLKNEKNLNGLINELTIDWDEKIQSTLDYCSAIHVSFTYQKFNNLIMEFKDKINAIYNKLPISEEIYNNLWKGFYKQAVVKTRTKLFPQEQQEIMDKRFKELKSTKS
jgi:hypothetical protein